MMLVQARFSFSKFAKPDNAENSVASTPSRLSSFNSTIFEMVRMFVAFIQLRLSVCNFFRFSRGVIVVTFVQSGIERYSRFVSCPIILRSFSSNSPPPKYNFCKFCNGAIGEISSIPLPSRINSSSLSQFSNPLILENFEATIVSVVKFGNCVKSSNETDFSGITTAVSLSGRCTPS
ncbi:hypothetical protein SDC9_70784 [bioreactor metagenome]|uniref:Uncharacterized protein n=1 Tax=bioreactor metagenome TaxID=1076179 RepID=A0A644YCP7_9ZZZZ